MHLGCSTSLNDHAGKRSLGLAVKEGITYFSDFDRCSSEKDLPFHSSNTDGATYVKPAKILSALSLNMLSHGESTGGSFVNR